MVFQQLSRRSLNALSDGAARPLELRMLLVVGRVEIKAVGPRIYAHESATQLSITENIAVHGSPSHIASQSFASFPRTPDLFGDTASLPGLHSQVGVAPSPRKGVGKSFQQSPGASLSRQHECARSLLCQNDIRKACLLHLPSLMSSRPVNTLSFSYALYSLEPVTIPFRLSSLV